MPFPTSFVTTGDGRRLAYCDVGPADGYPAFFLHGTPGGRYLRHFEEQLRRAGLREVTYDRPGYGGSDRLAERTVGQAAEDVAVIADDLGWQRFAVVGVSGGGPHALAVAAGLPDRVTRCATMLSYASATADDLDFFAGMAEEELHRWRLARDRESAASGPLYEETLAWVDELARSEELPADARELLVEAFRDALGPGPYGLADDYAALLRAWDVDLAGIRCPVLMLIARDDTWVPPAHGEWLLAHVPTAQALWADGGHFGPRSRDFDADVLAWLGPGERA